MPSMHTYAYPTMKHSYFVFFTLIALTSAQLNCGVDSSCGKTAPCCSEYGICATTPLHCGGLCQSAFSYLSEGDDASCYADRPSIGTQCVSGYYDFTNTT
jgi:hypothetical protein